MVEENEPGTAISISIQRIVSGICYYETQTLQNTTRSQLVLKAVSQW